MALRMVTFNVRRGNSFHQQMIVMPTDVDNFINSVKTGLHIMDKDKITVLYPGTNGKLIEIKSDDDIKYLNTKKLYFHACKREIVCSVELLVITEDQQANDSQVEIMALSNKIDDLTSKFAELSLSVNKMLEENKSSTLKSLMSLNVSQTNSDVSNTNSLGEQNSSTDNSLTRSNLESQLIPKHRIITKTKMVPITCTERSNFILQNNFTTLEEKIKIETAKRREELQKLVDKLVSEGFTDELRNVIILKRFNHDFEKSLNYLKTNP